MRGTESAFTLAEVLITLGIIGVVAALTIPALITKHQKKVAGTRAKAAYSQLFQAVQMAQAEYGDYSGWSEADSGLQVEDIQDTQLVKIFADKYILPYLQLASPPERAQLQEKGYKKGIYHYTPPHYYYYFAELANGTTLIFANNGDGTTGIIRMFIIMVDINGSSGENRFGHDIFAIMFNSQNGFFTLSENMSDDALYQRCAKIEAMFGCTELLKRNGWEINDKYPW